MDNGYNEWKENKKMLKKKRKRLFIKLFIPILIISTLLFIFGYDTPMFDKNKLIEFGGAFIALTLISLIIPILFYKISKYIPKCNKCGHEIKNIETDCEIGRIEYLGTADKTEYEKVVSTIKGKTVYPRGGYSMRNSVFERNSESSFEVNQSIPVNKKYHVYEIDFKCPVCKEIFCTRKKETMNPIKTKKD